MPRNQRRARSLAAAALVAACQCQTAGVGRECQSSRDCEAGTVCHERLCVRPACLTDADCPGGQCVFDVCVPLSPDGGGGPDGGTDGGGCDARDRCGSACCTAPQICVNDACAASVACASTDDCPPTATCDRAAGQCRNWSTTAGTDPTCEYRPPIGVFGPVTLWNYAVTTDAYTQVMMAPVVVDVNGDQVPDVLANFFTVALGYGGPGVMRAIAGDTGRVLWTTADAATDHVHPPASIAAGDLDGSGGIVVVTVGRAGVLIAFDGRTGARRWTSRDSAGNPVTCAANWGGPALADLDGDGRAEIVCGLAAFDATGVRRWTSGLGGGSVGPLTIAVDLDGDGALDVTDGATALRGTGTPLGWTGAGVAGFPATGDFLAADGSLGKDGKPEIVVVSAGRIALVNGQTGAVRAGPSALPSWSGSACVPGGGNPGNGGPPTVADFDGDGQPEVGVADLECYTVFELTAPGGAPAWTVKWTQRVQDRSSSVTGSSVFDFEGDGKAEVVYADEVALHVYRGTDGVEIFKKPHCSGTTYEYPVVVDVNANGRADIVIIENTYAASGLGCAAGATAGIHVFHDALDNWVNTRLIWNQHTYHVTNVCDGADDACDAADNRYGRVPRREKPNWVQAALNNFRQNVQGKGAFYAPDFAPEEPSANLAQCPGSLTVSARVYNRGSLAVPAGVPVTFYAGRPFQGGTRLGTVRTSSRLAPGASEVVSLTVTNPPSTTFALWVVADDDGTGGTAPKGSYNECYERNNAVSLPGINCQPIG